MIGGAVLGQYEFDEDKGYYVQTSTEQSNEEYIGRFLYKDDEDQWMVGDTPGELLSWLTSSIRSKEIPTQGWKYFDGETWQDDLSLTVTPGPLPPLPAQVIVTDSGDAAEAWPSYLGVFNMTQRWWSGRPVYVNTQGRFLFHTHHWMIGNQLGYFALRGSSMAHHSPVCEKSWTYFTGNGSEKPASVKILSGGAEYGPAQAFKQRILDLEEDCKTPEDYLMKYLTLARDNKTNYNENNSSNLGLIIAGAVLSILSLLIGVMSGAYKYSKKNEASPPPQVDNFSEQPPLHHHHSYCQFQPGPGQTVPGREGCIVRLGPPTPYSVSQSWNTGKDQQHPYPQQ